MQQQSKQVEIDLKGGGHDSLGNEYGSVSEMWGLELQKHNELSGKQEEVRIGGIDNWYKNALKYWENTPADFQGVLGGFGHTHDIDIQDSTALLERLKKDFNISFNRALGSFCSWDCGAGVGRITQHFLSHHFDKTDLLEPARNQMEQAKTVLSGNPRVGEFYQLGMQEAVFEHKYDLIWIQWVIGHLTDNDLIEFLRRCDQALTPEVGSSDKGLVVIKDNAAEHGSFYLDKTDFSIARSMKYFEKIFDLADYDLLFAERFKEFPMICMPVMKMVIKPRRTAKANPEKPQ